MSLEPLVQLADGRIVAIGESLDSSNQLVRTLRLFNADGSEVTTDAMPFGTGTDVSDPNGSYNIIAVLSDAGGGVRVLARDSFAQQGYVITLDASGAQVGTPSVFSTAARDLTVPFTGVFGQPIELPDGTLADATGMQSLFLSAADGSYVTHTDRAGPYESVSDSELIETADGRILRVSLVNSSATAAEVRGQFYQTDGTLSGAEFVIAGGNLEAAFGHFDVEVTQLNDGRIAVAYVAGRPGDADGSESAVYMTILNADGTESVAEQLVNTGDVAGGQDWVNLWALASGGFALTYGSETGYTPTESQNVRFFDADGIEVDGFQDLGVHGRSAGELFVSSAGVVVRMNQIMPETIYTAPDPNAPGVIGDEILISRGSLGELAQDAESATLADGRVVVVYDHGNLTGYVRVFDPTDDSVSDIDTISGAREVSVAALADGGFAVAWHRGDNPLAEEIFIQVYNDDGTVRTAGFQAFDGESEFIQLHATQSGFMLAFVNDEAAFNDDGTVQFFDANGSALAAAVEIDDGLKQSEDIDAIALAGGRTAVVWNSDTPITFENVARYAIFNADGSQFLAPTTIAADIHGFLPLRVVATDDGGFVTVHATKQGAFSLTVIDATGTITAQGITLATDQALNPGDNLTLSPAHAQVFDIELLGNGQLVLAYVVFVDGTNETDVRYGIYDLDGNAVLASQTANENLPDAQYSVELTQLDDGDVFLTFTDDTNVQFSSQSAIHGVRIQAGVPPMATSGADNLVGTGTAENIDLLEGNDTFAGGGGDDTVFGNTGRDLISGEVGADLLQGGADDDTLLGGAGDDTLDGGAGADAMDGGAGRDVVSYESATRSVRVDLQNDAFMYNDAVGDTFANIEVFQTGGTVDQLRGDASGNEFYTGGLSDRLYGRAGDDMLFGETGADALYGGTGADTMTGGEDAGRRDRYIYFNMVESGVGSGNRDVVTDFVAGEDRIEISRFDADLTQGFKQGFSFVGDTAFSGAAGELRFEQTGGNTIVQADVTGDGLADFEIELTGLMALTGADFLI